MVMGRETRLNDWREYELPKLEQADPGELHFQFKKWWRDHWINLSGLPSLRNGHLRYAPVGWSHWQSEHS